MPLAHDSLSHGVVAFGFFNIQSDMLLLEELFFFADGFCRAVATLAQGGETGDGAVELAGWTITDRRRVGNLHDAIAGVDHTGFIGATYREWPFPRTEAGFKQQPEGVATQARVRALIAPFGHPGTITLTWSDDLVTVGPYRFSDAQFGQLVAYVDRGGYPRWRDERRPDSVVTLVAELERRGSPWIRDIPRYRGMLR